jgi:Uma2 family endonuclease
MNAALPKAAEHYTYADYRHWPDGVRGELIDGVFYDMSPAPSIRHQRVAGSLYEQLCRQLRGKPCTPLIAPVDVLLPVQPDVLIVCDPAKLTEANVRGAPDFIVEVLSPATARKDQVDKLALYEAAGVREFWLLHPIDRVLMIYTQEANAQESESPRYTRPRVLAAEGAVALAILPEVAIDCDELFEGI